MKAKRNKLPRLTLKTARFLIVRELGISAAGLKRHEGTQPDIFIYSMALGSLATVTIDNGWNTRTGCFRLMIDSHGSGSIRIFIKAGNAPDGLQVDYETTFEQSDKDRDEDFADRVCDAGVDGCRRIFEKWRGDGNA